MIPSLRKALIPSRSHIQANLLRLECAGTASPPCNRPHSHSPPPPNAGEIARLKYAGTAVSAYEATPLASAGAIDLGCGFGFVDEDFRVGRRLLSHLFCESPGI